jgi:hypothetical protein
LRKCAGRPLTEGSNHRAEARGRTAAGTVWSLPNGCVPAGMIPGDRPEAFTALWIAMSLSGQLLWGRSLKSPNDVSPCQPWKKRSINASNGPGSCGEKRNGGNSP